MHNEDNINVDSKKELLLVFSDKALKFLKT